MALFEELKRRNVFKVAIAYIIVSWLLLQVAEVLVPALYLPTWFLSGVAFLLILGFPVAIIFAWAFELTPEGLKLEHEVVREHSISHSTGRRLDFIIIGLLLAVSVYFVWESRFMLAEQSPPVAATAESLSPAGLEQEPIQLIPVPEVAKSIAVLPFVNMSSDPDQEYFSDGISEELLNVLAKYPGLRVAARTSSFQFKGKNQDIVEIAEKLRVNHVLEGSVRKSGNTLRITAQLIETDTGYHLWSETYDREMDDVFAIQDEISAAIGAALQVHLALDGAAAPTVTVAADTAAFEAYMRARQLINLRSRKSIEDAVVHLERALALDEGYAPAHAQLAIAITLLSSGANSYGDLTLAEVKRRSEPHIRRAFELDSQLPEAFAARALVALTEQNFRNVELNAKRALELNPSYADALNWLSIAYSGSGQYREYLDVLLRLQEIDPLSVAGRFNFALLLATKGQMDEALVLADELASTTPRSSYVIRGNILVRTTGELAEALGWLLRARAIDPDGPYHLRFSSLVLGYLDLLPEALRLQRNVRHWVYRGMANWPALVAETRLQLTADPSNSFYIIYHANALYFAGDLAGALVLYGTLLASQPGVVLRDLSRDTTLPTVRAALGRLDAGDKAGADVLINLVLADQQRRREAGMRDYEYYRTAAMLEVIAGNEQEALQQLATAFDQGLVDRGVFSEPAFVTLHDQAGFQALEAQLHEKLALERGKALQLMCFNNPVPEAWQPLPATCEGVVDENTETVYSPPY